MPTSGRRSAFLLAGIICLLSLLLLELRSVVAEFYAISPRYLLSLENSNDWRDRDRLYEL